MNKKILLVQPEYPTSPFPGPHLPVGLGYLAEQLINAGIDFEVVDMNFNNFSFLEAKIRSFNPDYIGVSLMTLDIDCHYRFILKIKKMFPSIKIIAGGPHISFMKAEALSDCPAIDFGIVHEGEEALKELIQSDNPAGLKSVIYRAGKKIIYNGHRGFIQDLDKFHFPVYEKFDLSKYGKRIDIISSRGCPFNCIFCGAHLSMGKNWRARSAGSVVAEIDFWHRAGYVDFNFVDSNFFFEKQRVLEICRELEQRGLNITFSSDGLRAKDADPEMLRRMKQCGLKSVAIGVESANEETLRDIKKGETLFQIETAIKTCLDLDIGIVLFFIIGLPGETKERVERSFEFALRYPVSEVYFHNANPIPGTELHSWAVENKYLLASREDMFKNIGGMGARPLIATPEFSFDERKRMYKNGLLISKKVKINFYIRRKRARLKSLLVSIKNRFGIKG